MLLSSSRISHVTISLYKTRTIIWGAFSEKNHKNNSSRFRSDGHFQTKHAQLTRSVTNVFKCIFTDFLSCHFCPPLKYKEYGRRHRCYRLLQGSLISTREMSVVAVKRNTIGPNSAALLPRRGITLCWQKIIISRTNAGIAWGSPAPGFL